MLIESFSQMILRWLRIPPGTSVRKSNSGNGDIDPMQNEYIQAMVDITVDDICIGDEPLSVNFRENTPDDVVLKLKEICKEFNSIVRWVATDLLVQGYSVYDVKVSKNNRLILLPYLDDVDFYITKEKKLVVFEYNDLKKQLKNKLVFINFSKSNLTKIEDKTNTSLLFKVAPAAMQLSNSAKTISGLSSAEDSLAKLRAQLGRVARWANVDIGTTQGDQQNDVVTSISESINANSSSLAAGTAYTEFDDNIPVLPNRRGLGKVELVSDIPNANIKDLADIDYWLSKLNLIMRFPATYMDFSKNLDATAVSLVRGDIRYKKLCKKCSSKITSTINDYFDASKFKDYEVVFSLTNLPSSEDDDVVAALQEYIDFADKVDEFIMGEEAANLPPIHRLELLQKLFAPVTNSPALQEWFEEYRERIKQLDNQQEQVENEETSSGEGGSDVDIDFTQDFEPVEGEDNSGEDLFEVEETETPTESEDFEMIEPQTNF